MMSNESAVLGMLADLYKQNAALQADNAALRAALTEATKPDEST